MVIVWRVFRDTAVDYRLVMAGALAPDVVDAFAPGIGVAHTVASGAVLLVAVMVATRGRRRLRRRLLALPVGAFLHLLLDGAWANAQLFWWPVLGSVDADVPLSLHRPLGVVLAEEGVGVAALAWWWWRFRLQDRERRRVFFRTGRLGRDLVA